jgi:hypothetical protein
MATPKVSELRGAASEQFPKSQSPYFVFREDPQGGWIIREAADYATAEGIAIPLSVDGKFEVFVLPADPRHGLLRLNANKRLES